MNRMPCADDWRTSDCPRYSAESLQPAAEELAAEGSAASWGLYLDLGKTPEEEALWGNRHLGAHYRSCPGEPAARIGLLEEDSSSSWAF